VSKDVDCQVFGDQLDVLVEGGLSEDGIRQLRHHAAECTECSMQLKVKEHLMGPSLAELESEVPEELLASVWGGVRAGLEADAADSVAAGVLQERTVIPIRPRLRWAIPALAAATLVLVFSTGFLSVALGSARDREATLAQQVAEQQRWLAELGASPFADPAARTAALAGRSPWARALSRQESITIQGLQTLLERVPGDRAVLSQDQLDSVLRSRIPLPVPLLREALARFDDGDGVLARDLLRALETLDVSPDMRVPTAELMDLLS
jgi:hypothetical protein